MDLARLTYMANQIAREFAAQGEAEAVAATANHLRLFWDPRMKAQIVAGGHEGLSPIAASAVARLDCDASIARGLGDANAGRTKPAHEVFDRLKAKYENRGE